MEGPQAKARSGGAAYEGEQLPEEQGLNTDCSPSPVVLLKSYSSTKSFCEETKSDGTGQFNYKKGGNEVGKVGH